MKLDWRLSIYKVDNGYILKSGDEDETFSVIEENDCAPGEVDAASGAALLYEVMEYFDLIGTKHDKNRIMVEIVANKDVLDELDGDFDSENGVDK